jgi:hypothetical protein
MAAGVVINRASLALLRKYLMMAANPANSLNIFQAICVYAQQF